MKTWIFQANPDDFDIDGYLASRPAEVLWLVTRYQNDISIGDRVYLWRNQGSNKSVSGVVAEGIITSTAQPRNEAPDSIRFWRESGPRANSIQIRAGLRLIKVATSREVIRSNWCKDDPILHDLPNLRMAAATNFLLTDEHARRLGALWSRTGRDWDRSESIAGLWAYVETTGIPVSMLPGSPVADVSLLIGRALTGVYAKVMNFRSLDPHAPSDGMPGAGDTDRQVWAEFYDNDAKSVRSDILSHEFVRLWPETNGDQLEGVEAGAATANLQEEAKRLEKQSLEELVRKYESQIGKLPPRPLARRLTARDYQRDPLVVAIARKRAAHRCEINPCQHPIFQTADGPYVEVHHIVPLSEGGADIIENVACLCAAHHREVHLGVERNALAEQLRERRREAVALAARLSA